MRRQIEKMVERGLLIEDPRGGVTPPEGMVEKLGLAPIMTEFTRTAEMLIRLGVIDRQED